MSKSIDISLQLQEIKSFDLELWRFLIGNFQVRKLGCTQTIEKSWLGSFRSLTFIITQLWILYNRTGKVQPQRSDICLVTRSKLKTNSLLPNSIALVWLVILPGCSCCWVAPRYCCIWPRLVNNWLSLLESHSATQRRAERSTYSSVVEWWSKYLNCLLEPAPRTEARSNMLWVGT